MNDFKPHHSTITAGYCAECGQDLSGVTVYADHNGPVVECPVCHVEADPHDSADVLVSRTEPQEAVWSRIDEAEARLTQSRSQLAQFYALGRPRMAPTQINDLAGALAVIAAGRSDNLVADEIDALAVAGRIVLAHARAGEVSDV